MLTLDQKLRWTAKQLLSHPWITAGDSELASHDLSSSLGELKRYNARRRFRAAAQTIIVTNRMARLTNLGGIKKPAASKETATTPVQEETDQYKPPSSQPVIKE